VMPVATADIKVDAVRGFGGEVLLHGANFDEAKARAIELAQQQGFTWVPPFDHPMVIAGQGTLALELLQQDAHIDRVFVPVGGGGLAAGVAVPAMKDLFEDVRAVAEPSGALALAGMKKYIAQHNIRGERLAHILSGANVNFHGLRYVSERCELGEQREALLAVTIP
ncbi:threonine ammonia-lyase, biosynthetic, partial [Klebsiella aerogenes]